MPKPQLKLQLQPQRSNTLIKDWKAIPKAERVLLIELSASFFIMLNAPNLGLLALIATCAHYGYVMKPHQDAVVREYQTFLKANIGNSFFQDPKFRKFLDEVGGTPAALHNACVLQFK